MLRRAGLLAIVGLVFATANVAASTNHAVSIMGTSPMTFGFSPASTKAQMGDSVTWTNNSVTTHTTTSDATGLWSMALSVTSSYAHTFDNAGTFAFHCMIHPFMKGSVTVGLQASAMSGARGTTFTITVGDAAPPSGWTNQVQKSKGSGAFAAWKSTTATSLTFKPKKNGAYHFRSRLFKSSSDASGYSPVLTITVS